MIPFSVLDLSAILEGGGPAQAIHDTLELAQKAESLGFKRFWLAEHHNMPGIASAATSLVISHVAAGTSTIRVGAGGIMLPNHAPLAIAEQFGTLDALYPGRIDLGLGRAPGSDQLTARALRRTLNSDVDDFPNDVLELQGFLEPAQPGQQLQAVPGAGSLVPLWLLGSSLYSAQLAAALGLPFAFASHFAPDYLSRAMLIYRENFKPSAQLQDAYAMAGVNVVVAETDAEARHLFSSMQQQFVLLRRGNPGPLPPPIDDIAGFGSAMELAGMQHSLAESIVGSVDTVTRGLAEFIERTGVDELMVTSRIFDRDARLRSLEGVAQARAALG